MSPELLVSLEQEIDLWVVQPRIDVLVHVPVLGPQLGAVVRPSLAGELAVEDQDVPLLLGVAVVPGWVGGGGSGGCQGEMWQEGLMFILTLRHRSWEEPWEGLS